jgi:hypothetical protein
MISAPAFKQYYARTDSMSHRQRQFYDYWLKEWQKGKPISVEGQVSYLFCYLYSVLEKGPEKALPELIRLRDAYSNEEQVFAYCCRWISDCYVVLGQYHDALEAYPILSPDARSSYSTDALLSLKALVGSHVSGRDIITLCGPNVTAFGKKHLNKIIQYIEVILEAQERNTGVNILTEWIKDSRQHPYSVFGGSYHCNTVGITAYDFSLNEKVTDYVEQITREAENTVREEAGIPKVGEGWVGETELYYEIKTAFPNLRVEHHARPEWLHNQHLDIYIPELSIAIEYQGIQHEVPVEYFGGEKAFNHRQHLDAKKRRHCKQNDVHLMYVYPNYILQDIIEIIGKERFKQEVHNGN